MTAWWKPVQNHLIFGRKNAFTDAPLPDDIIFGTFNKVDVDEVNTLLLRNLLLIYSYHRPTICEKFFMEFLHQRIIIRKSYPTVRERKFAVWIQSDGGSFWIAFFSVNNSILSRGVCEGPFNSSSPTHDWTIICNDYNSITIPSPPVVSYLGPELLPAN